MSLLKDEKYMLYLQSREWSVLRNGVKQRAGGMCERCKRRPMALVHHLTYIRLYHEKPEDLQGQCKGCHAFIHGKSDQDPAKQSGYTMPEVFQPMPQPGSESWKAVQKLLAAGRAESDAELMAKYRPESIKQEQQ
jgi:hypothetical protein